MAFLDTAGELGVVHGMWEGNSMADRCGSNEVRPRGRVRITSDRDPFRSSFGRIGS